MQTTIRVCGIWIDNGKILLETLRNRDVWGIPGGSLEDGETLEGACLREYLEETGLHVRISRLAVIHENFWQKGDALIREYGFYFVVEPLDELTESPFAVQSLEGHMRFEWFDLEEIARLTFVPHVIAGVVPKLGDEIVFLNERPP